MPNVFDASTGEPVSDSPQTNTAGSPVVNTKPTVDLIPCSFGQTFQNPCFWILVGVIGTGAVIWLFDRNRD
jgi:hypothetical protein